MTAAFLNWLSQTSLLGTVLGGIILLVKLIFRNRLSPGLHYRLWFFLLVYLVFPGISAVKLELAYPAPGILFPADIPQEETGTDPAAENGPEISAGQYQEMGGRNYTGTVFLIWCVTGTGLLAFYSLLYIKLKKKIKNQNSTVSVITKRIFNRCRKKLGITGKLKICGCGSFSPSVIGIISAGVIIPADFHRKLNKNEIELVLNHELIHIKRKDYLINILILVLQLIHWFNPLLWLIFRQIRKDQEIACDADVLAHTGKWRKGEYSSTLLNVSIRFSESPAMMVFSGMASAKNIIKRRITMIHKSNSSKKTISAFSAILLISLISISCLSSKIIGPESKTTVSANKDFSVEIGFRDRNYDDKYTTRTLAFWIEESLEGRWDNMKSLIVYATGTDREELCRIENVRDFPGFYSDTGMFFQLGFDDYSITDRNISLEFLYNDGEQQVMDQFSVRRIQGDLHIGELDAMPGNLKKEQIRFHISGNDSDEFLYWLDIYGPDGKRVYMQPIEAGQTTQLVDLSGFAGGVHTIGMMKCDPENIRNMVSREYKVILE